MNAPHELRVERVGHPTADTLIAELSVPPGLRKRFVYSPGQYLPLRAIIDGRATCRAYSIASMPGEPVLRLAIKRIPGGVFSCWAHRELKAGTALQAYPPAGNFGLPMHPGKRRRYLAVAAGTGITPILPIIGATLRAERESQFTLAYGNRSEDAMLFRHELAELKNRFVERFAMFPVFSREPRRIDLQSGRIDAGKWRRIFHPWDAVAHLAGAYLCGPVGLMNVISDDLLAAGMAPARIRTERFLAAGGPAGVAAPTLGAAGTFMTVIHEGASRQVLIQQGVSVLDSALMAGLDLPHGCKTGVCTTCRCKLLGGRLQSTDQPALSAAEKDEAIVLSCQNYYVDGPLVVDFDIHQRR